MFPNDPLRMVARLTICLLTLLPQTSAAEPQIARTIDGQAFAAELVAVSDQHVITFRTAGGERAIDAVDLVHWSHPVYWSQPAQPRRGAQVLLADGSLLLGELVQIADDRLRFLTGEFGDLNLSLQHVRGVLLLPPDDAPRRDKLTDEILSKSNMSDRLVLVNGDELSGMIRSLANGELTLETELGVIPVELSRIVALLFSATVGSPPDPPGVTTPGFTMLVGLRDGSLLRAASLRMSAEAVELRLGDGTLLASKAPRNIVSLQPLGGQAVYLSDLEAHAYLHIPYLDAKWPYHTDRNVLGTRLRCGGRLYSKGLGMHSAARVTYKLPNPKSPSSFRTFQAELAIDDQAGKQGSVTFRLFTSDGGDWTERFASPMVRGGDRPRAVSVDIRGALALSLAVDYADRADVLDHANWLNARLIK